MAGKKPKFYQIDAADKDTMRKLFQENHIDAVIHFAGYKCVPESTRLPIKYYRNNLDTADIGKIAVHPAHVYVAVRQAVAHKAWKQLQGGKIKGKTCRVRLLK